MKKKDSVVVFNRFGIVVTIDNLFFDKAMEAAVATISIVNDTADTVVFELCDVYQDGELIKYAGRFCEPISPFSTYSKRLISLAAEDERETVLRFHEGEIREFSFRLCAYVYDRKSNFQYPFYYLGKGERIILSGISFDKIKVLPSDCFEIKNEGNSIIATADYHIPFEYSKKDALKTEKIKAFKSELRDQLATLKDAAENNVLLAQFVSVGNGKKGDIENYLIYNIGSSAFADIAKSSIAFAEIESNSIDFALDFGAIPSLRKYHYKYAMVRKEELQRLMADKRVYACWNEIPIDRNIRPSAERYWKSIRNSFYKVSVLEQLQNDTTDCFGMYIELHMPEKVSPAIIVKPLVDGIVCAFHKQSDMSDIMAEIAKDHFEKLIALAEKRIGILGQYPYVVRRGNSFQWSPADDRLKFCWVEIVQEETAPYFSGKIFEW